VNNKHETLERMVLAAMLMDMDCYKGGLNFLDAGAFTDELTRKVFEAIQYTHKRGFPVDILTVTDKYRELHKTDFKEAALTVTRIADGIGSTAHFRPWCMLLVERQIKREIALGGYDISAMDGEDVFDILATNREQYAKVIEKIDRFRSRSILEVIAESKRESKIVKSGYADLNKLLGGGFEQGDMCVIGGRTSMGKTAFAMNLLLKHGGIFFSLETVATKILHRLQANLTGIPLRDIKQGKADAAEIDKANSEIVARGIIIEDQCRTIEAIETRIEQSEAKTVFVDYLQLVAVKGRSREEEVSNVSKALLAITKKYGLLTFSLSQLSRETEKRTAKMPLLADLRESGSVENDADHVLLLFRPAYYNMQGQYLVGERTIENELIVNLAKSKDAETGQIALDWKPETMRIYDLTDTALPF